MNKRRARNPFRLLLALVAAGALCAVGGAAFCSSAQPAGTATGYVSPYDWAGLERDGDRLAYYEQGALRSRLGIDVSSHQGTVDWEAVAADGIDFALVRLGNRGYTEGSLHVDEQSAANLDGARAAGLDVGAYFFSQATTVEEALEEADLALKLLDGRTLELPVAFDHEPVPDEAGRANRVDGQTLTACALAFCERLEAAGYATMVYGNAGDMARYDRTALGGRPVWFAEYHVATPNAPFDFTLWQYSNSGDVQGVSTPVDMNLLFLEP